MLAERKKKKKSHTTTKRENAEANNQSLQNKIKKEIIIHRKSLIIAIWDGFVEVAAG